jgi:YggT family protein
MQSLISNFLDLLVDALTILIIARAVISWVPHLQNKFSDFIVRVTDPFLNPIRHLMPAVGGVDFSPLVLFFLLQVLRNLIFRFFAL